MAEWKKLGDVCDINTGKLNANAKIENGKYPFFTCDMNPYRIDTYAFDCEALILAGNGNIGSVKYYKGKFNAYQRTYVLNNFEIIEPRLLFHYLNSFFKPYIEAKLKKGSVPYMTLPLLSEFQIPVPSLTEQKRTVEQLDTFTSSIENLKEQIALRRKQYEHYLDVLYGATLEEMKKNAAFKRYAVKTFNEIGNIVRGKRFVRTDIVDSGVPCIHYGDMYTTYGVHETKTKTYLTKEVAEKLRFANTGDVVIVGAGENDWDIGVGLAWLGSEPAAVHDACYILEHKQEPMYISYFLRSTNYHLQIRPYVSSGKICSFSAKDLGKMQILIPTLSEQQRIVSILDTFEASIQNLEAQLKLREKQYEYYRNKLLTFE